MYVPSLPLTSFPSRFVNSRSFFGAGFLNIRFDGSGLAHI